MSNIPAELKYVDTHEWLRAEADGTITVGITDHAQELLGDVVYVELPKVGAVVAKGGQTGVVESVKSASEIYAPVSGEIIAVNENLTSDSALVNQDPQGAAWFYKIKITQPGELDSLKDENAYAGYVQGL